MYYYISKIQYNLVNPQAFQHNNQVMVNLCFKNNRSIFNIKFQNLV